MTTVLHIKSSSNPAGYTRQIGSLVAERLQEAHPGATVIERDLAANPVPHVSPEFLEAMFSGKEEGLALSNRMIDELYASDVLVIEAPMYNFGIPSVLKAWIDHVARARKTFRYTENGPEGLLKGKKAFLILSRGGIYSEGAAKPLDYQETYLRAVMNFIGITDIETICIEGVAMGPEKTAAAMAQARQQAMQSISRAA